MRLCGTFQLPDGRVDADVVEGCTIARAADESGIMLNMSCAEQGTCSGCAVDLISGEFEIGGERVVVDEQAGRRVLGCQTRILSDQWKVAVPRRSLVEVGEKVQTDFDLVTAISVRPTVRKVYVEMATPTMEDSAGDFERICRELRNKTGINSCVRPALSALRSLPDLLAASDYKATATVSLRDGVWELIDVEAGDASSPTYGVAVDIGTTTVVCGLVDLTTGELLHSASCYNQQIRRADDVASRIVHAGRAGGIEELRQLITTKTINRLVRLICNEAGIASGQILRMVVSGNTVMSHLLLGLDPKNMGGIPFQPAASNAGSFRVDRLDLDIHPAGLVDVVPSISAYVGGDITSDIHIVGMAGSDKRTMLLDLGTNGEIVVCNRGKLTAAATAAGPAFEGGRIGCGMRASAGAVERIRIDPDTLVADVQVIGDTAPFGICGSGLIDLIGEARRVGLLDETGRFDPAMTDRCDRLREVRTDSGTCLGYVVVPKEQTEDGKTDVIVDERDISTLLQAKAATYAGMTILLERAGLEADELDEIYLAGGFAKHIHLPSAITMGLLPDVPTERYRAVGNTSLAGAVAGLVDRESWEAFGKITSSPEIIELNTIPEFQEEYINALFVPNMMADRFPSVVSGR